MSEPFRRCASSLWSSVGSPNRIDHEPAFAGESAGHLCARRRTRRDCPPLRCRRPRCRRPGPPGGLAEERLEDFRRVAAASDFRRRGRRCATRRCCWNWPNAASWRTPGARRTAQSVAGAAGGLRRRGRTRSAPATFPHTPATAHHLARPDPPRRAWRKPVATCRPLADACIDLACGVAPSAPVRAVRHADRPALRRTAADGGPRHWASWARWNSACRRTST